MTTDVDVQYFSHLNGLNLGNNWGDLINLLDTCLVNGISFSSITSVTIDENGDINLTLFSAHNAMLFQIVELSGFSPSNLNGKYRIKGVPSSTQLILKAVLAGTLITTIGTAKLASLGYEIVYTAQYKRVYRALNPTAQHPYIRVDETISDGINSYTSTYAKSAMVGLIENMTHIDDYLDTTKLQLPINTTDFAKNWKITGTGTGVVRGWSRWHYAGTIAESSTPAAGNREFTLIGNKDAFYHLISYDPSNLHYKYLCGAGLYNNCMANDVVPNWFLLTYVAETSASSTPLTFTRRDRQGGAPLTYNTNGSSFFTPSYSVTNRISNHAVAIPFLASYSTGANVIASNSNLPLLEIPFYSNEARLHGSLKHVSQILKTVSIQKSTPQLADNSMYVSDGIGLGAGWGAVSFYLGELE